MYIFRKRSKAQQTLSEKEKICPSCHSSSLFMTDPGRDRNTFTCKKCSAISTFTKVPKADDPHTRKTKEKPTKKLSMITIRDRRKEETDPPKRMKAFINETVHSIIEVIKSSMKDNKLLSFNYISTKGDKSFRTVEPYKLTTKEGNPVLFAYDLEGNGIRTFKINNISYAEIQTYAYEPRYPIEDKLEEDTDK